MRPPPTPMALLTGFGLIASGLSAGLQPSTRPLPEIVGFGFSLAAIPSANLGRF